MSNPAERPPKGVILPETSLLNPNRMRAGKFFDDPDYIYAELERDENGRNKEVSLHWAAKDMGARATLFALRDVLTQGDYEGGSAYILHDNAHIDEALDFFSGDNERRAVILGSGAVRMEGEPKNVVAEVLEGDEDESVHAFGFDNGLVEISYHAVWPKTFHDIPSMGVFLHEKMRGLLRRSMVEQCIAATARKGLLADTNRTLNEFGEYIPGLKR